MSYRKKYTLILGLLVLFNIIMYEIHRRTGISLIYDWISSWLWLGMLGMFVVYPYGWKGWWRLLTFALRGVTSWILFYALLSILLSVDIMAASYISLKVPYRHNEVIIKQYATGFHHMLHHIQLYERLGIFFKMDTGEGIYLDEDDFGVKGGIDVTNISKIENRYIIDNKIIFEWETKDKVNVYYKKSTSNERVTIEFIRTIDLSEDN